MYKDNKRITDTNGYVLVHQPEHHKAMKSGVYEGYVYEHVLIAELDVLDRKVKEGEVVHHLDENKANNSPDNLIVLENPQHVKLHGWLNKFTFVPTEKHSERIALGCIRCKVCEKPISFGFSYCSHECQYIGTQQTTRPSKEVLEAEIQNTPMTKLGEKYGVSDNAIKKWCVAYGIELQNRRGHWTKIKHNKV